MSFNIQGSLAIQVKDGAVKFLLYPANAYLSPDKSYAVLYQASPATAKTLKLTDGYLELDYVATTECKDLLSQIALQNKPVALTVSTDLTKGKKGKKGNDVVKNSITGFTYPAQRA